MVLAGALVLGACRYDAGIGELTAAIAEPESPTEKFLPWVGPGEKVVAPPDKASTTYRLTTSSGHVVFRDRRAKRIFRIEARPGAVPEDLSHALDGLSPGTDSFVNMSANGDWLLVGTSRFKCGAEQHCVARVKGDLSRAQVVVPEGEDDALRGDGFSAVSSRGDVVVFPRAGGPHGRDLYALHLGANGRWGPAVLLTGASNHRYHQAPALSADGSKVVFDCSPDAGSGPGTAICEAHTDGTGFREVANPRGIPGYKSNPASVLQEASYEPSGDIVFEGGWNDALEQVWRVRTGSTLPVLVSTTKDDQGAYSVINDNSPCALPDGRIVSLWLGRPNSRGHELKVMNADGTNPTMLLTTDTEDIGIGCGN